VLREKVSDETFEALTAKGRSMSREQAIAFALEETND
jgi:hypothetical protein